MNKTEKDIWVEMSIREIWTQCHFAELSYKNIDVKARAGNDLVFSSIHSFLSHCAMVSKMLVAKDGQSQKTIGDILKISKTSEINNRVFRNHLEHYDERLKDWIKQFGASANVGTYNIGSKSAFQISNMVFVSHYDPTTNTFTFVNDDYNLGLLVQEVSKIKQLADKWVKLVQTGTISPPFI